MTLVEIMIVVIIMALIATGVAFAVVPMLGEARENQTVTDMQVIRQATTVYMIQNNDECPSSVGDLVSGRLLTGAARTTDAWGSEFAIQCDAGSEPVVVSPGADRQMGTADDLRTDQAADTGDQ
jgi:type II secretory pathway pseudopilin PulG